MEKYINRHKKNPLITPEDIIPSREDMHVVGVFNAGATTYNGETLLLLRVAEEVKTDTTNELLIPILNESDEVVLKTLDKQALNETYDFSDARMVRYRQKNARGDVKYLTSLSHFRLARSTDGVHFEIDQTPTIFPQGKYERWGIEDPRITKVDNTYHIIYTSVSDLGVSVSSITTQDFKTYTRHGLIFEPENKDVCLFPEKINGMYHAYHRPVPNGIGGLDIWTAKSPDLIHWGQHTHLFKTSEEGFENGRMGGGAPPIKTTQGWLNIYHAADKNNRYCLGAFLSALDDPTNILAKTEVPLMEPTANYEQDGFFGHVVFSCGVTQTGEILNIYYGASDETIALATISINDVLKVMNNDSNS